MVKITTKYSVWEEVHLLSGYKWWVYSIIILQDTINYQLYDGGERYVTVADWQIKKTRKKICYTVETWV